MGRIVDLCTQIAESAEEGEESLVLPPDVYQRLRAEWSEDDIDDALGLVQENMLQSELFERADSLSARLLELLGAYGGDKGYADLTGARAVLTVDVVGQLARRVSRLEEILDVYRDGGSPDRAGFDALQMRLADLGIETEMSADRAEAGNGEDLRAHDEEEEEEETR